MKQKYNNSNKYRYVEAMTSIRLYSYRYWKDESKQKKSRDNKNVEI